MRIKAPVLREFNVGILRVEAPIVEILEGKKFLPNVHDKFIDKCKYIYMDIDIETGEILNPDQSMLPNEYEFAIKTDYDNIMWSIRELNGTFIRLKKGGDIEISMSSYGSSDSIMQFRIVDGFIEDYVEPFLDEFFEDDTYVRYL